MRARVLHRCPISARALLSILRSLMCVMGESLSPDHVFDFPMNETHPAYDFFAHAPLPGYAVIPAIEEIGEPVAVAEEEHVIAPVVDVAEGQMDALMMDMEEDLAVIFGDEVFADDSSNGDG
ncbi:hypothetical protein Tco_0268925 [Tanacetum coccineum]